MPQASNMTIEICQGAVAKALETPFAELPDHERFRISYLCGIPAPLAAIVADIRAGRNVSKLLVEIAQANLSLGDKEIKDACAKVRDGKSVSMVFSSLKSLAASLARQTKKPAAFQASGPTKSK